MALACGSAQSCRVVLAPAAIPDPGSGSHIAGLGAIPDIFHESETAGSRVLAACLFIAFGPLRLSLCFLHHFRANAQSPYYICALVHNRERPKGKCQAL